jgi:hypothetical protein
VIAVDTAAVTRINARSPKTGPDGTVLEKREDQWVVLSGGREFRADEDAVRKILVEFARLKADHLIGSGEAVRKTYNFTDSAATHLEFITAGGTVLLTVGKESYNQQGVPQTAVNVPGEEQVFGINALLQSVRDLSLSALRPHELVTGDPAGWQRVTFTYPADSGYVLERNGGMWMVDTFPADSDKVAKYFRSLSMSRAQNFADTVHLEGRSPAFEMKVEDSAKPEPTVVKIYPYGYTYVVTSSINPGNVMYFDPIREFPRLLRPRRNWIPGAVPPPHVVDR